VRLFVERAQSLKPAFALTEREAPAVAELVARLEGIPLALELAAARVRLLSVADINARLKDRFKLLTGGDRTLQNRQQTLRALSTGPTTCSARTRSACSNGSAFSSAVSTWRRPRRCAAPTRSMRSTCSTCSASLVEKSLVMSEEREDGSRYRMLETIREYALEKLVARGDETATAVRHCQHFFAFARRAAMAARRRAGAVGAAFGADRENLRAATSLALAGGVDPFIAIKIAVALMRF